MLSLCCLSSSTKAFLSSPSLFLSFLPPNPRFSSSPSSSFSFQCRSRILVSFTSGSSFTGASISDRNAEVLAGVRPNFPGVRLEETVEVDSGKVRLDSWISSRVSGISRARVQSSIRLGLVKVNGRIVDKVIELFPQIRL